MSHVYYRGETSRRVSQAATGTFARLMRRASDMRCTSEVPSYTRNARTSLKMRSTSVSLVSPRPPSTCIERTPEPKARPKAESERPVVVVLLEMVMGPDVGT